MTRLPPPTLTLPHEGGGKRKRPSFRRLDQAQKPLEQIGAVLRARRGLRVVLDREHGPIAQAQSLERAIEQRQMRLLDLGRQAVRADREPVVLAGDLDLAGYQIL